MAIPPTLVAQATSRERLANTVADVTLGCQSRAATAPEAQEALFRASELLMSSLREADVRRLRTQVVELRPVLEDGKVSGARILGYAARVTVSFEVDASQLGRVLGTAMADGANSVERTFLRPRDEEVEAARTRLAAEAARAALARAQAVAEALGARPGPIQLVSVDDATSAKSAPPGVPVMRGGAATITTEAGDTEVKATVSVSILLG